MAPASRSQGDMAGRKHTSRPPASRAPSRKLRLDTTATTTTTTGAAGRQKGVDTVSPTESIVSQATVPSQPRSPNGQRAGAKRKDREHEHDAETSIRVIVRCRGRNEREIKENEAVALSTNGVKGDSLELSMGPSALANKIYHFDRVFSPAADQSMIYDDVVMPMLDEVSPAVGCFPLMGLRRWRRFSQASTAPFLPTVKPAPARRTPCRGTCRTSRVCSRIRPASSRESFTRSSGCWRRTCVRLR